jgi:DNA polymerase III epsilon subunit-like protein
MKLTGKSRKAKNKDEVKYVYCDIEIAFSDGQKPFIGRITILGHRDDKPILSKFFKDPREIRAEDIQAILEILYGNYVVCCDPSTDRSVLKHDSRRCGIKAHITRIRYVDVQDVERCLVKKPTKQRPGLETLARKYRIKPLAKFHDSYSDVLVIRDVFRAQLKELNTDECTYLQQLDTTPALKIRSHTRRGDKKT